MTNLNTSKSIINKEALRAYQVLNNKNKIEIIDAIDKLISFQLYLANLCNQISKKKLKDKFVFQWIFTNEPKEKDYKSYCKANLFSASDSLNRIISKLEKTGINEVQKRMLLDFICDLKPFIASFDDKQDYTWLLFNTNTHITNFYHDLAESVFWNGKPGKNKEEQLVLATSTPFIIRQSIEYKIKRILGIDFIHLNGRPQKTAAKVYFKALKVNLKYYIVCNFDFELIELMHSWSHYYVHGGYRAEPWRTETALNYLKKLFYSGETLQANIYSRFAAIEVNEADLEKIRKNTEESIKREEGDNAVIKWLSKPEVAVIKERK